MGRAAEQFGRANLRWLRARKRASTDHRGRMAGPGPANKGLGLAKAVRIDSGSEAFGETVGPRGLDTRAMRAATSRSADRMRSVCFTCAYVQLGNASHGPSPSEARRGRLAHARGGGAWAGSTVGDAQVHTACKPSQESTAGLGFDYSKAYSGRSQASLYRLSQRCAS